VSCALLFAVFCGVLCFVVCCAFAGGTEVP